jgi:cell division protein FtsB
MKILLYSLVLILIFLSYKFWNWHNGLIKTFRLHKTVATQQKTNDVLTKQNQQLANQIYHLKQNKNSVELLAREKLGMTKKDEQYYRIIDKSN